MALVILFPGDPFNGANVSQRSCSRLVGASFHYANIEINYLKG
jgi:hypothetical protein